MGLSAEAGPRSNSRRHSRSLLRGRGSRRTINVGQNERWASVLGGAALSVYGLKRRSPWGIMLSLIGANLVYRGVTGHCPLYNTLDLSTAGGSRQAQRGVHVEKAVTILKPREEVYGFWRQLENLPRFMQQVESVRCLDDRRSRWVAKGLLGMTVEWEAEITEERANELIAWRSVDGARLPNEGEVRFRTALRGHGTEVQVKFTYYPRLGKLAATVAKVSGQELGQQLAEDLRRLKCLLEAGEIPTIEGQPVAGIGMTPAGRGGWNRQPRTGLSEGAIEGTAPRPASPAKGVPGWTSASNAVDLSGYKAKENWP